MGLKIGITGPHSSGKSTILQMLKTRPEVEGMEFLEEVTRTIEKMGFPINEAGGLDTQVMVTNAHLNNLLTKDNFITDRTLLDGTVYTSYALNAAPGVEIPKWFSDYSDGVLDQYMDKYDIIFYVPSEFAPVEDGCRSASADFHKTICDGFDAGITKLWTDPKKRFDTKIHLIQGTPEERITAIIDVIRAIRSGK
jgi:hypothetical protein